MYQYKTKNGKYVFFTEEPLSEEELKELDENQEAVRMLCELSMRKLPATPENLAKLGGV